MAISKYKDELVKERYTFPIRIKSKLFIENCSKGVKIIMVFFIYYFFYNADD